MEREALLQHVAPCSLLCYTCPALKNGGIAKCANQLCRYFEGYYDFNDANMPEEYRGWLQEFQTFYDRLARYTDRPCLGCRSDVKRGCIEDCVVPECVREKGIDFCAECPEFPCEKGKRFFAGINNVIGKDWENGSRRIAEVGIERYFEEKKDESHYKSYKK